MNIDIIFVLQAMVDKEIKTLFVVLLEYISFSKESYQPLQISTPFYSNDVRSMYFSTNSNFSDLGVSQNLHKLFYNLLFFDFINL